MSGKVKNAIRFIRKSRNMTQQELADKLGVNRSYISFVETGVMLPTVDMLLEIARALDCLVVDLYSKDDIGNIEGSS